MNSPSLTTTHFAIQQPLIERHTKTLEWLSATALWKNELAFLQKLLDQYSIGHADLKPQMDHYQNILLYYREELVDSIASRLRLHEKKLAKLVIAQREESADYFAEHDQIMNEAQALGNQISTYREEIYALIERVISTKP